MQKLTVPLLLGISLTALNAAPTPPPKTQPPAGAKPPMGAGAKPANPALQPPLTGTQAPGRGPAPVQGPKFPGATPNPPPTGGPGKAPQALQGLTDQQRAEFVVGLADFVKRETPESGLGPIFNEVSCVACHDAGGPGGAGRRTVVRFGRVSEKGFDPLVELGGPLLQRHAIAPEYLERIPMEANITALRVTTPLFGAGLVEAIPDSALQENAAAAKTDGVAGRVAMVQDPASGQLRAGRFGWKAQHASLLAFAADAYLNEMGITSRLFPKENAPNGNQSLLEKADAVADPEDQVDPAVNKTDVEKAADFMRYLAPAPQLALSARAQTGKQTFVRVGCAQCHKPEMTTAADAPAGLANQKVSLYSDLLLHDMGILADGIEQLPAKGSEMRTAPLWGLRLRDRYLHDGRATSVDQAIRAHDGEAKVIRDRYNALPAASRQAVLEFLNTL